MINPFAAYTAWLKPALYALALLALVIVGWRVHKYSQKLQATENQLAICVANNSILAQTMKDANAIADRAKKDAADQAENAVTAMRQADRDRAAYAKASTAAERAIIKARKTPECRAQLDAPLCVDLL